MIKGTGSAFELNMRSGREAISRKAVIAAILGVALVAFEIFNFDTTQFALTNLLGDIRFAGIMWATILAIAFCAIDFAGLVRLFTPQRGREEPRAVWFMTGAWFLGTIANSILTWWAISVSLLSHDFGNEVLSREALLKYVPIFVAMLVWLTRILFIGAFSVAGEDVIDMARSRAEDTQQPARPAAPAALPVTTTPVRQAKAPARPNTKPRPTTQAKSTTTPVRPAVTYEPVDDPFDDGPAMPKTNGSGGPSRPTSRIQQRPPMPGRTPATGNMHAQSKNNGH
jgi:hypothetical protein